MLSRSLKLLIPPGPHKPYLHVTGNVGGIPDSSILGHEIRCHRMTLPPFLSSLTFSFMAEPGAGVRVQNFYHLGDFFVVSTTMLAFLKVIGGCDFEVERINIRHPNGVKTEDYWAAKVKTRIPCVDPELSTAKNSPFSSSPSKPFSQLVANISLTDDLAPFFANAGSNTYSTYVPYRYIDRLVLRSELIPKEVNLFELELMPGYLVVDEEFSKLFGRWCKGGAFGYYFWTLGFDGVWKEYERTAIALR